MQRALLLSQSAVRHYARRSPMQAAAAYSSTAALEPTAAPAECSSQVGPGVATGIGILKGMDDPSMSTLEDLPPWLAELAQLQLTLGQLQRADEDSLNIDEKQRLLKLRNRGDIRHRNMIRSKKK